MEVIYSRYSVQKYLYFCPPPPTQLGVEGSVYLKVRGTVGRYQSLYGRPLYDKLMPDHCRTLGMKLGLSCA